MSLLIAPSVIHTQANPPDGPSVDKLVGQRAFIGSPTPKDQDAVVGGIVRHVVLLDPGLDIEPGDSLFIVSWGQHRVDPTRALHVFTADPEGSDGLETITCLVGDRVMR